MQEEGKLIPRSVVHDVQNSTYSGCCSTWAMFFVHSLIRKKEQNDKAFREGRDSGNRVRESQQENS